MSGFLVIIGSILVYDLVITERENSQGRQGFSGEYSESR